MNLRMGRQGPKQLKTECKYLAFIISNCLILSKYKTIYTYVHFPKQVIVLPLWEAFIYYLEIWINIYNTQFKTIDKSSIETKACVSQSIVKI